MVSIKSIENDAAQRLAGYVNALRPIIYINHFDFQAVDDLIRVIGGKVKIKEYNEADGEVNFDTKTRIQKYSLNDFLMAFDDNEEKECFLVLKDVHHKLCNPEICARLKSIAEKTMFKEGIIITVFLVCSELILPPELEKIITIFDIPLPDDVHIRAIIEDYAENLKISMASDTMELLTVSFKGLSDFEIRQILNLAYQKSGIIDNEGAKLVLKEKEQIIKKSGILELVHDDSGFDSIGGLEGLKSYLQKKEKIFKNIGKANEHGIDIPKGILIVGYPGCGKTLSAKATAWLFKIPLLRLDIGRIMGKYVGESESNLLRAIKTAEAVSPCVLWIDELEKAFAGINSQGGASDITTKLFGQFLTWLQEKKSAVYVVATSNNIDKLPPEFLRRGRFDELFLVKLPTKTERKAIFEAQLKKRKQLFPEIDISSLLEKSEDNGKTCKGTEGFSGADIESVVKEAIESAFFSDEKLTNSILQECINNTISLSETMKDEIKNLEESYKKHNFKDANKEPEKKKKEKKVKLEKSDIQPNGISSGTGNEDNSENILMANNSVKAITGIGGLLLR
jgi:SpoVK/Ycf46/Vps4 family AAA+-type ATPase